MTGRRESFAETVARLHVRPPAPPAALEGRSRELWGDPAGMATDS